MRASWHGGLPFDMSHRGSELWRLRAKGTRCRKVTLLLILQDVELMQQLCIRRGADAPLSLMVQ